MLLIANTPHDLYGVLIVVLLICAAYALSANEETDEETHEQNISTVVIHHPHTYYAITNSLVHFINPLFQRWHDMNYTERCEKYRDIIEFITTHKEKLEKLIGDDVCILVNEFHIIDPLGEEKTTLLILEELLLLFEHTDVVDAFDLSDFSIQVDDIIQGCNPHIIHKSSPPKRKSGKKLPVSDSSFFILQDT